MFRADTKAKRLAKIKSKTYHRLKKKQKRKLMEKLDIGEDSADDEEKRLQREVERARERATLKHKNTGKWAKAMKARGELDEDQRQEVLEMLQRSEKLRRKIHAKGGGDEDEDNSDDETGDEGQIRASAFNEVARLVEEEGPEHSKKSLFDMKFMKDAIARDDKRAQDMADEFLKDLARSDAEVASNEDSDDPTNQPVRIVGRVSFRPGAQVGVIASVFFENLTNPNLRLQAQPTSLGQSLPDAAGDSESISAVSSHTLSSQSTAVPPTTLKPLITTAPTSSSAVLPLTSSEPGNPWLNIQPNSSSKIARKKNEIIVGKSSGLAEKSKNRLRKHQEKHENEREKTRDDAAVEISMSDVLNLRRGESGQTDPPPVSKANGEAKVATRADVDSDEGSGVNSEVEEQEQRLSKKRKGKGKAKVQGAVKPFAQRDLVSLAFAGDKVVQVRFPPKCCTKISPLYSFVAPRIFKRLNNGRSSKMHRRNWTRPYLDGCAPFSSFTGLSTSSPLNCSRVRGVGQVQKKHHRNRSSLRRLLASTPDLEKTMVRPTLSSLRNGTRRLRSTRSRISPIPIRARHSTRGACRHRLGPNGTPGLGSRGEHCRGWSKRCISLRSPTFVGTLLMPVFSLALLLNLWSRCRKVFLKTGTPGLCRTLAGPYVFLCPYWLGHKY